MSLCCVLGTAWCQQWGQWGTCECFIVFRCAKCFLGACHFRAVTGNRWSNGGIEVKQLCSSCTCWIFHCPGSGCHPNCLYVYSVLLPARLDLRGCLGCQGWRWGTSLSRQIKLRPLISLDSYFNALSGWVGKRCWCTNNRTFNGCLN